MYLHVLFRGLILLIGFCFAGFVCGWKLRSIQCLFLFVASFVGACLTYSVYGIVWFVAVLAGCLLETPTIRGNLGYFLALSAFLSIFLESCHLLSYKFICFIDICLKTLLCVDLHSIVTTGLLIVLFACVSFVAAKFNVVDRDGIKMMSVKKFNVVVPLVGLFVIFVFKCHLINLEHHTEYYELMWNIMLFMIIVYFTTYVAMRKISKLHAVDVNYTVDTAIGKALCSSECSLDFRLPDKAFAYEREKLHFSCELSRFGLDYGFLGYSQLVLCLIVLSNTKHEESEIDRIVCSCMEPFADLSKKNIFELLDDVLANARLIEKIDPDTYEHIDDDVKTGRELLKYFLKIA